MGFNSGGRSWAELERALSGQTEPPVGDGGDSPAWSRRREGYAGPPPDLANRYRNDDYCGAGVRVPYAELHAHSNFSFLDGTSHPEQLVEEAARAGLDAIALTDHDGMYGVVRFAEAARELGVRTVFGAELSLGLSGPQNGVRDPEGQHLLVLARELEGYRRLCRVISNAHLRGEEKGRPVYDVDEVVDELPLRPWVGASVEVWATKTGSRWHADPAWSTLANRARSESWQQPAPGTLGERRLPTGLHCAPAGSWAGI